MGVLGTGAPCCSWPPQPELGRMLCSTSTPHTSPWNMEVDEVTQVLCHEQKGLAMYRFVPALL